MRGPRFKFALIACMFATSVSTVAMVTPSNAVTTVRDATASATGPGTTSAIGVKVTDCEPATPPAITTLPVGFDPVTVDAVTLSQYGLPPRPAGDASGWIQAMQSATHWEDSGDGCLSDTSHSTSYAGNWSGYQINASAVVGSAIFTYVDSTWVVPTVASHSFSACGPSGSDPTPDASMWTGIGSVDIIQAGTDSCSDTTPRYRFWTEDYPQTTRYEGPSITGGNKAYVSAQWEGNNTCEYFQENETSGGYSDHVHTDCTHQGAHSADYIFERVGSNYTQAFSPVRQNYNSWHSSDSESGELTSTTGLKWVMTSNCASTGTVLVSPSGISNSDAGFTETHYADDPVCN